jgi:hypothetical protein
MKRLTRLGGIGGIAFAVLTVVTFPLAATPGGNYTASDLTSFVASGHRPAVFVSLYLAVIAASGLICLFARLRQAIVAAGGRQVPDVIFWGAGLAVAIAFLFGWIISFSVPMTYAFSNGGFAIAPAVTYAIVELGLELVFGAGGILMGLALIGLFIGSRGALPAWLRWVTLVAGIVGLASPAFFPFFALLLWGLVTGIWLLSTAWRTEESTVSSTSANRAETVSVN